MRRRCGWLWSAVLVATIGCAHSEDEWQAQLRTIGDLKTKLDAEQAQAKKARADLDESTTKIEQLKQQLRAAGVDVANLDQNLEAQARATEEQRLRGERLEAARRRFALLRSRLGPLAKQGVAVTVRNNRLTVELPGDTLFEAGREALKRDGRQVILAVAEAIRSEPGLAARTYQVVDHVDPAAAPGRAKDAFGLSVLRAREVVSLLVQPSGKGGGGLDARRWSAAGYGDADPLKANDTPEARQANRRCEIVLQPAPEEVLDLRSLLP
jgi:chemotaxis protein MotB